MGARLSELLAPEEVDILFFEVANAILGHHSLTPLASRHGAEAGLASLGGPDLKCLDKEAEQTLQEGLRARDLLPRLPSAA